MYSDLAGQIAIDASGCPKSEVNDLQIDETDQGYNVSFKNKSGKFTVLVTTSGVVDHYSFEEKSDSPSIDQQNDDSESVSKSLDTSTDNKESNSLNETIPEDEVNTENNAADRTEDSNVLKLPEGSLPEDELIRRAAALIGMGKYNSSDFNLSLKADNQVQIDVTTNGMHYSITIDPVTGQGSYSYAAQ